MSTPDASDQGPETPGSPTGPATPGPAGPGPAYGPPDGPTYTSGRPAYGPGPGGEAGSGSSGPSAGSTDHIASFFASVRRTGLVRTPDRWIGGVASGLALRLGVDALLVRAAFGVLALVSGAGLVLYALAWALLPEQSDGRIHLEETIRGRFDAAIAGAGLLLVLGLSWNPGRFGWWGPWGFGWLDDLFGIALVVFVVSVFVTARRRRRDGAGSTGTTGGTGAAWAPPGAPGTPSTPGTGSPVPPRSPEAPPAPTTSWAAGSAPGTSWAAGTAPGTSSWPGSTEGWAGRPASSTDAHAGPSLEKRPSSPGAQDGAPGAHGSYGPPSGQAAPPAPPSGAAPAPHGAPTSPVAPTVIGWTSEKAAGTKVSGPGRAAVGLVAGLALLAFAGLLVVDRSESFDGDVGVTSLGVLAVLAGIGIAVAGLRGRRSGTLGFFAIAAVILASPLVALQGVGSGLGAGFDAGSTTFLGDSTYRPTSAEVATDGFAVGLGSTTIDLTAIDLPRGETVEVPVHVGAGDVTVVVPADVPVSAQVDVGAGSIDWRVDDDWSSESGVGRSTSFENQAVRDGETARIHVTVAAGAGTIIIEETS